MLEYSKIILEKVSFDTLLFKKELRKLKSRLAKKERKELNRWCHMKFATVHPEVFKTYSK